MVASVYAWDDRVRKNIHRRLISLRQNSQRKLIWKPTTYAAKTSASLERYGGENNKLRKSFQTVLQYRGGEDNELSWNVCVCALFPPHFEHIKCLHCDSMWTRLCYLVNARRGGNEPAAARSEMIDSTGSSTGNCLLLHPWPCCVAQLSTLGKV
jgi:hypothetical protein